MLLIRGTEQKDRPPFPPVRAVQTVCEVLRKMRGVGLGRQRVTTSPALINRIPLGKLAAFGRGLGGDRCHPLGWLLSNGSIFGPQVFANTNPRTNG